MEAELGSDNEYNDHVVKKIKKDDEEEREYGMDVSDEELIDRQDQIFIKEDEYVAHRKFLDDMLKEDEDELENVFKKNYRNGLM